MDNQFFNVRDLQDLQEAVLAGVRNLRGGRGKRDVVHIQPAPIDLVLLRDREWALGRD